MGKWVNVAQKKKKKILYNKYSVKSLFEVFYIYLAYFGVEW